MTTKVKDLSIVTIEKIINKYEEKIGMAYFELSGLTNPDSELDQIKTRLKEIMRKLSTIRLEIQFIIDADAVKKH